MKTCKLEIAFTGKGVGYKFYGLSELGSEELMQVVAVLEEKKLVIIDRMREFGNIEIKKNE